jgi:SAM-dependent methyltransferase
MSVIGSLHQDLVFNRRVRILSHAMAELLPRGATVLDVGCGNGLIALLIGELRPDVTITGIDVLVRPETHIPVEAFDGSRIPRADGSVDTVMFVDVLHHTEDPEVLLREAKRVARQGLVLKDHTCDGFLAGSTLRFMDWVGNAHHGVDLPYNYWPERRWREAVDQLGLIAVHWQSRLGLYPWPAGWLFDRSLHFIARLDIQEPDSR